MDSFLEKFFYVFSVTIQYATVFPIKNKFWPLNLTFYFDLLAPFFFLKWNRFFSNFTPVSVSHISISSTYCHGKCVLIYKLKDFGWWKFDSQSECTGVLISKVTILRSTHLINIYSFWTFLSKNLLLISLIIIILFWLLSKNLRKIAKTA